MTNPSILLCSDLDRTLLPNGAAPESAEARPRLRTLAARPELMLAYVSGRHQALLRQAIADYAIPNPDYAIGDVGTTLYEIHGDHWRPWREWAEHIAPDWSGADHGDLAALFADLDLLRLQEPEKQNTFKLSYYAPSGLVRDELLAEMRSRLAAKDVRASLIWSVDEAADIGLLDVLPASATKLHAMEFLMARRGFDATRTVFAGDSGNDLPVVTSGRLRAVLVRNAHSEVVSEASRSLRVLGLERRLYVARGGFHHMNGNYSAGVLEGLAHFLPETEAWMR
nr:HAD-IIB family hydrolase [Thiohalomonas denitrificans]